MDKNALSMRVPVDRFMGLTELRDESRWQDEYEAFMESRDRETRIQRQEGPFLPKRKG